MPDPTPLTPEQTAFVQTHIGFAHFMAQILAPAVCAQLFWLDAQYCREELESACYCELIRLAERSGEFINPQAYLCVALRNVARLFVRTESAQKRRFLADAVPMEFDPPGPEFLPGLLADLRTRRLLNRLAPVEQTVVCGLMAGHTLSGLARRMRVNRDNLAMLLQRVALKVRAELLLERGDLSCN